MGRASRSVLGVTVAGLTFQVGHLFEHTAQMTMWAAHPQRAPWMTPWAHWLSMRLGRIDNARISETTTQMQRGMELLHLVGNAIFLAGAVGLLMVARHSPGARRWARATVVIQGLHVAEHVALTLSLFLTSRALGVSTGFGTFDGTVLSTYRVWWHGLVNLLATGCSMMAVRCLAQAWRRREHAERSPRTLLPIPLALTLGLPLVLGFSIGRPVPAPADVVGPAAAAVVDHHRSGMVESADVELIDVAGVVGLDVRHSAFRWDVTMDPIAMMGGGACWIDVDRDGWLDLFVTDSWADGEWGLWDATGSLPTSRLFRNVGGVFEDVSADWGADIATRANGCVAADFDADGFTDLYITTSRANVLLWNDGGTRFVEGAEAAGVDAYGWHTGAAAGDLNGDGLVDLVVAGYADLNRRRTDASTGFPNTFEPIADVVMLNRGAEAGERPVFEAIEADVLGIEPDGPEYGLGVVLLDVDDDGDLDLLVANDTQPNRLYRNDGAGADGRPEFVDIAPDAGVADPNSGMGIAVAELDGDGVPEFVVTNLEGQGHAALLSNGDDSTTPRYSVPLDAVVDLGRQRTGWGTSFGDVDLDGDLDLIVASGAIPIESLQGSSEALAYFENTGDSDAPTFTDSSIAIGLGTMPARNGRAVALADYDNDGDLDVLVTAIGQPLALLQNQGAQGHWLTIDPGSVVPGLRATVSFADGTSVERRVSAGGSWLSSEDPRIHVGLGAATTVDVEIEWPSGETQEYRGVAADQVLRLTD